MDRTRKEVHADWAHKAGYVGANVGVAIMDTGIMKHPDFDHRIMVFRDFCNNRKYPYDDNGHGTHVAGIIGGSGIAGRGKYRGIAPDCHFIIIKALDKYGNGNTNDVIDATEWMLENKEKYNIKILNISVGMLPSAREEEKKRLIDTVEKAWKNGIVVVTAAGNNGPDQCSVTIPGICKTIITVGSSDDDKVNGRQYGLMSGYSGRGPTKSCIVKPEITAPGTNIMSCCVKNKMYETKSGTSMSTPVVAGACALLLGANKDLTPAQVKLLLHDSAKDMGKDKEIQGWGKLDIRKLLEEGSPIAHSDKKG